MSDNTQHEVYNLPLPINLITRSDSDTCTHQARNSYVLFFTVNATVRIENTMMRLLEDAELYLTQRI